MKKYLTLVLVTLFALTQIPAQAANTAGGKCSKVNQKVVASGKTLTCTKVGGKLIWKAAATPVVKPTSKPSPTPSATPSPSPTDVVATLPATWKDYSSAEVISRATAAIDAYFAVKRTTNQEIVVAIQPGADPIWKEWITNGATLVSQAFEYPKLNGPFYDVAASDVTWLTATYKGFGFTDQQIQDRVGGFNAGAPAFGGTNTNTWNLATIARENLVKNNKAGMAQTAGHEFFHAIQENLAKKNPGANGEEIPNWFWEGPAMFVGLHSAGAIKAINFDSEGRSEMLNRYKNGRVDTRLLTLKEVKINNGIIDPYAIGYAGTEFIIAQVGVEKFLNIYAELGKGKSFAASFEAATGFSLDVFYEKFEAARASLGFAKG